jgi:hypothetical protein
VRGKRGARLGGGEGARWGERGKGERRGGPGGGGGEGQGGGGGGRGGKVVGGGGLQGLEHEESGKD